MAGSTFDFDGAGGHRLSGRIDAPETTPRGWAIFAHCFTCGKDSLAAARIARALARAGIGVLRFDFAGIGTSGGLLADGGFAADVDDLVAAAGAMTAAGMAPSLLVGHSLGGAAALSAATMLPEIRAVATIGAPADVSHLLTQIDPAELDRVMKEGEAEVAIAGRPFVISRGFIEETSRHDIEKQAGALHRPLLVLHAPLDEVVPIEHASRIFLAARHPKSFVSLDTADHLLTSPDDANYAAQIIGAWVTRYLPPLVEEIRQAGEANGVTATETGAGTLQVAIESGRHRLLADEPVSVGGLDSGLAPYDLVSAGLAACTAMTMRLYANRKGIPLKRARVTVDHSRIADMTPPDRFTRTVSLEGPLDPDQRSRLLEIAERCPVDLTLVRGSDVLTRLADEAEPRPASALGEED
ncbi:MAG TPA: bifunctional alpha/beta hydrolase/OsmC family protein [Sphingomicrobium sp.]|jgi:putative redox protein|nr:bifunctional alpha/beta hydrolase/OsmC family protein [Sphingomicrobium sp.]